MLRRESTPAPSDRTRRSRLSKLPTPPSSSTALPPLLSDDDGDRDQFVELRRRDASAEGGPTPGDCNVEQFLESNTGNAINGSGLTEIEQHLKQKSFTIDQANHLIEILRSRTPDLYKANVSDAVFNRKPAEGTSVPKGLGAFSRQGRCLDHQTNRSTSGFCHSKERGDIGSSPVDIAKAYMKSLSSASDCVSRGRTFKKESPVNSDRSASELFLSPAAESPICWPGAVVPNYANCLTPLTVRGKAGLYTSSQTPYSAVIPARSTFKFRANADSYNDCLAGRKQQSTPFSGTKQKKRTLGEISTFVDPIRRVCPKITSPATSRGPDSYYSSLQRDKSDALKELSLKNQAAFEEGASEAKFFKLEGVTAQGEVSQFAIGSPSVHPKSSETAQKILKHLERAIHSPVAKSQQSKHGSIQMEALPVTSSTLGKGLGGRTLDGHPETLETKVSAPPSSSSSKEGAMGADDGVTGSQLFCTSLQRQPCSGSRPALPLSSTTNPLERSKNNGFSFSFPAPSASNNVSEPPPTPTMTPSVPSRKTIANGGEASPKFTFGSSRIGSRLVFSFGSDENSPNTGTTTPTFNFGSGKQGLSFGIVNKDSICY